jgi:spore germination protein
MPDAAGAGTSPPIQVWGYVPDFDTEAAFASALENRSVLTGITQVRYFPDRDGKLRQYPGAPPLPEWIRTHGMAVVPLIANQVAGQWDRDLIDYLLSDPTRRGHHVRNIVARTITEAHPAVELDYEFLATSLRDAFSAFVEELAAALHEHGRMLAVAVHAKSSEPGDDAGSAAQDWERIGAAADRVAVMTYDWDPTHPGPISPLAWTREVLAFAASCIPLTKVMQGIPLYGYRWTEGQPPSYLTYQEFMSLARRSGCTPRRDAASRHLVLVGAEVGIPFEAWLPDSETVMALGSIGKELGVAGYTAWRLGGEESTALTSLHSVFDSGSQ